MMDDEGKETGPGQPPMEDKSWTARFQSYSEAYDRLKRQIEQEQRVQVRLSMQALTIKQRKLATNPESEFARWSMKKAGEAALMLEKKLEEDMLCLREMYAKGRQDREKAIEQLDAQLNEIKQHLTLVLGVLEKLSAPLSIKSNGAEKPEAASARSAACEDQDDRPITAGSQAACRQSDSESDRATEIYKWKTSYLDGMRSGANICDNEGKLIIAKNQAITEEVILAAERANRLGLLIVNILDKE